MIGADETCEHRRFNPNGCLDCPAVWCFVCRAHHRGRINTNGWYWDEPSPTPCIERLRTRVADLEAQVEMWKGVARGRVWETGGADKT